LYIQFQNQPETVGQFTGLKDENGVDIYEGDLLEWDESENVLFEVFFDDGYRNVGFSCSRTHYQGNKCGGYVPDFKAGKTFYVRGNIYENPELLQR
jgi:uncharacterized phage protein (TIGR01671 family)